jgi:NTP pyrophosphatase (non-canonical NTP hydrolase)
VIENQSQELDMDIGDYQVRAWRYDQHPDEPGRALTVALLGLGGEVGSLQTNLKKIVRDGPVYLDSDALAVEDLGDVLWYVAATATWLGVDLRQVAEANLAKIAGRWPPHDRPMPHGEAPMPLVPQAVSLGPLGPARVFDGTHDATERLPRQLEVHIAPIPDINDRNAPPRVLPVWNGRPCGDVLGDNAYSDDGYRYHDAFHLAYLAVLGWSPVFRALLRRKRKTTPQIDDVEDGGRAIAIEEGLSAFVFEAASRAGYYEAVNTVDGDVLRLCRRLTVNLEVGVCSSREWERAIIDGYSVWRLLREYKHAAIACDLDARSISARPLTAAELADHMEVCQRAMVQQAAGRTSRIDG